MNKRWLIGGSGSTGSSLLKNILSRHSMIFAGSETSLFCKKPLFDHFRMNKWRIPYRFPFGLRNEGYHLYNGIDLLHPEYGHNRKTIAQLINRSHTFHEFSDGFFTLSMDALKKDIWIEKTPCNAWNFESFLETFPGAGVIHMVRDPLPTLLSLVRRGYNPVYATGVCLLNHLAALRMENHPLYIRIRYENLIRESVQCINGLTKKMGIPFEEKMLLASNPLQIKETRIPSWSYDEMDDIDHSPTEDQLLKDGDTIQELLACMRHLRPSPVFYQKHRLKIATTAELSVHLGYSVPALSTHNKLKASIKKMMFNERIKRASKAYANGLIHFPLEWHD
ncbi:MAG TPA: sulfotransferase [Saprospiraceae bacterium]|nr:sulfotransferase [Saprospiraceae bacterium]